MRDRLDVPLSIYGDRAYPVSGVLLRAPKGRMTATMQAYATLMSHYRESVEWVFGKMGELKPFVTGVQRKLTGSSATSKENCVAALLTNYHTCRYGGVANRYFDTLPPIVSEYRAMHNPYLKY